MDSEAGGKRKWQIAGYKVADCPECGRKIVYEGECGVCGWKDSDFEKKRKADSDKKAWFGFKWSSANKMVLMILAGVCIFNDIRLSPKDIAGALGRSTATILAAIFLQSRRPCG